MGHIRIVSSAAEHRSAELNALAAAAALRDDLIRLPVEVLKPEEARLIEAVDCWRKHQEARGNVSKSLQDRYTDDPGITAAELLKQINGMYAEYTFLGDDFIALPVSYLGLVKELNQTMASISASAIYGIRVVIVSDWDTAGIELMSRSSKEGREVWRNYGPSDQEARHG